MILSKGQMANKTKVAAIYEGLKLEFPEATILELYDYMRAKFPALLYGMGNELVFPNERAIE